MTHPTPQPRELTLPLGERAVVAYVGLGANLGDRRATLDAAVRALGALPGVRVDAVSRWHDTAPVGGPAGQPRYLNGVVRLVTGLLPGALLARLQLLEEAAGRDRAHEERNGPRTLDLDLLLYAEARIDQPGLRVPHPRLEERTFVVAPLAELAPDLLLAGCGRTARERLADLRAAGSVSPGGRA